MYAVKSNPRVAFHVADDEHAEHTRVSVQGRAEIVAGPVAPAASARLGALIVEDMAPRVTNDASWRFGLGEYAEADVPATLKEINGDWPTYVSRFAPRMFAPGLSAKRPKLAACVDAIDGGVEAAHIVDGRRPHSLLLELFTDAGIGTKITA